MKMVSILITPNIHNSHHHRGITDPWPMLLSCFLSSEPYRSRPLTSYSVPCRLDIYFSISGDLTSSIFLVSMCLCCVFVFVETWFLKPGESSKNGKKVLQETSLLMITSRVQCFLHILNTASMHVYPQVMCMLQFMLR